MRRLFPPLLLFLLLLPTLPATAQSTTSTAAKTYVRVGLVKNAPYVESEDKGLAVELWEELSRRANLDTEFVWVDDLDQGMEDLRAGRVQALVGGLPAEPDLAADGLLSLPYAYQSLGYMSIERTPAPWDLLTPLLDKRLLVLFGILLGTAFFFGTIFWLFERNHDDEHVPGKAAPGVLQGMWFALITVTTVGYGDVVIKTSPGRLIASVLLILTIVIQATLTAALTSVLTIANLGFGPAGSISGLDGQRIAVIGGGPAEAQLERYGAKVEQFRDFDSALKALRSSEVSGIAGPHFELQLLGNRYPSEGLQLANLHAPIGQLHFAMSPELERLLESHIVSTRRDGTVERLQSRLMADSRED